MEVWHATVSKDAFNGNYFFDHKGVSALILGMHFQSLEGKEERDLGLEGSEQLR